MRKRAYRPEVPGCLEGRALLSGVAGLPANPVVLSQSHFFKIAERVRLGFQLYGRDRRDIASITDHIRDVSVWIPFARVDGLGPSIDRILGRMQHDVSAHVPGAVRSARSDVLAVIRASVEARVQAGEVVVR
ncbi:hypothetical protein V5E97_32690 [Singulisphaera sp. Ch08]|uniref:Uncharacterized protein n=1 Tax=Singulisphaera sp. Ch08 TaxID=3120278 RepID=A0AAU7CD91_9BACT